jgi:hypothetical protein
MSRPTSLNLDPDPERAIEQLSDPQCVHAPSKAPRIRVQTGFELEARVSLEVDIRSILPNLLLRRAGRHWRKVSTWVQASWYPVELGTTALFAN